MLNNLQIIGHLGRDPELRYTPTGTPVCNFSVATTEKYKDRQGERQEITEWHNIVAWRQLAEICGKYLHKGKQVYISGPVKTRSWTDDDGTKRYKTELIANTMQMLGSKQNHEADHNNYQAPAAPEPTFNSEDEIPF